MAIDINLEKIRVGTRLRLDPSQWDMTSPVSHGIAEVLSLPSSPLADPYSLLAVKITYRDAEGLVQTYVGDFAAFRFQLGRGRVMLPGEAPPNKGDTFGVTGINNDYSKQRRQGRRTSLPTPPSAETPVPIMATAKPPVVLTAEVAALLNEVEKQAIGTACPHCGSELLLRTGTRKSGDVYAFVGCGNFPTCRASVKKDGRIVNVTTGVALPPIASVATATPATATPATSFPAVATPAIAPASKAPKPVPPTYVFPAKLAMALAADVRKMQEQGTTEMTFSLRKALAWGTASTALAKQGMTDKAATAGGFLMTVFDREVEESQETLTTLYQSHFGQTPANAAPRTGPLECKNVVATAIAEGLNLWVSGPTGSGKTYTVLQTLQDMGREYIRFQGGGDVTRETLLGFAALENGSSVFRDGPLTIAARKGLPLVLDEFDKLRDEVQSELSAVLEGNALVLSDNSGERIDLPKGFCIVATANSVGRGEGVLYSGTRTVNEAIRDRFVFLTMDYDNDRDLKVLSAHIAAIA